MTLTEFLLARIAEDEAVARDAHYDGQVWIPEEEAVLVLVDGDFEPSFILDRKRVAAHAAHWSPARVLAECEAKRRIVDEHHDTNDGDCATCAQYGWWGTTGTARPAAYPCPTLRLLALPHSDHPDFDESWRP